MDAGAFPGALHGRHGAATAGTAAQGPPGSTGGASEEQRCCTKPGELLGILKVLICSNSMGENDETCCIFGDGGGERDAVFLCNRSLIICFQCRLGKPTFMNLLYMLFGDGLADRSSFLVLPHAIEGAFVEHGGFKQFEASKLDGNSGTLNIP